VKDLLQYNRDMVSKMVQDFVEHVSDYFFLDTNILKSVGLVKCSRLIWSGIVSEFLITKLFRQQV